MSQAPLSSVSYFSVIIGFKSPVQNHNLWPIWRSHILRTFLQKEVQRFFVGFFFKNYC